MPTPKNQISNPIPFHWLILCPGPKIFSVFKFLGFSLLFESQKNENLPGNVLFWENPEKALDTCFRLKLYQQTGVCYSRNKITTILY